MKPSALRRGGATGAVSRRGRRTGRQAENVTLEHDTFRVNARAEAVAGQAFIFRRRLCIARLRLPLGSTRDRLMVRTSAARAEDVAPKAPGGRIIGRASVATCLERRAETAPLGHV